MNCQKHHKECVLVCSSCESGPVCSQCLNEDHRGHSVSSFDDAKEAAKTRLKQLSSRNQKYVVELDSQLICIESEKKLQNDSLEKFNKEIENRRQEIHSLVDTNADEIMKDAEKTRNQNCDFLDNQILPIKQSRSEILALQKEADSILNNESIIEIFDNINKLDAIKPLLTSIVIPDPVRINDYNIKSSQISDLLIGKCPVSVDTVTSKEYYGTIPSDEMSDSLEKCSDFAGIVRSTPFVENEFQQSQTSKITVIERYNSEKCWVKCRGDTSIKLIDKTGSVHRLIALDSDNIRYMCVGKNDKLYVCSERPNCIKEVALPNMDIRTFCHTGQLLPQGIASISSGELYLTLVDNFDSATTQRNQRLLVRYNRNGEKVASVGKNSHDNNLFCLPFWVSASHSEDTIAVLNHISKNFCYLMLFDDNLNLKFRYLGNGETVRGNQPFVLSTDNKQFAINNIRFNSKNYMVISEVFSKSVQLLCPSCDVIKTVFTDCIDPFSLCIVADDELWVGYNSGRLKVWRI